MGVNYADVIERMKWAARLKNDSAVARALEVTPQALSNYKKRGEMPSGLVLAFSERFGVGLDWLISGRGEVFKPGKAPLAGESPALYSLKGQAANVGSPEAEEAAYIMKLLKVLRSPDESHSRAIKSAIDTVLKASDKE
ncbi:MAG: helix-turn-helix domain containing protein [Candidatus Methylomirabilis sp.]|nr:helix-turn-helix domain containing protein [Deltaproteobacteria bacterium]